MTQPEREAIEAEYRDMIKRRNQATLALEEAEREIAILERIRRRLGLNAEANGESSEKLSHSKKARTWKVIREYLQMHREGASAGDLIAYVVPRMESDSKDRPGTVRTTLYNLKTKGNLDLKNGLYYWIKD